EAGGGAAGGGGGGGGEGGKGGGAGPGGEAGGGAGEPPPTPAAHLLPPTLDYLEQLRDASLILVDEPAGQARYRMLETLREYAWEQLEATGELAAVRARHRDWFLQLAESFPQ